MGAVVGPTLEEETEAEGRNVVHSPRVTPLPAPIPGEQLGSLESGPHQRGSLRQTDPDLGPHVLGWYRSGAAGMVDGMVGVGMGQLSWGAGPTERDEGMRGRRKTQMWGREAWRALGTSTP